ncbi:molybdopterin molybdotransferase MoeA [Novosphingobium flavum]|uniref:Molybdopterin molybdenumtransferase n=1 Tax=Novosphingobium flavum TaxID=1778672 RepID=A0A7X1FT62_9SPHN|nr:molybdopterin molybdotransferase MoeA [Novosphingobium flavum]MBC2666399.1 molybdopterin molybdotransferase MoeA [Novosphingobium flavum]
MNPPLLSLEEAQARLIALASPLSIERVDVPGTLGRYLAEPLRARRTQPAAHVSAMDGYAVRADDLAGPWHVVGESAAGHPFHSPVNPGEAVRISTGAIVPSGAQAVIVQEDVTRSDGSVSLTGSGPNPCGRHIRGEGSDFRREAELLPAGTRIGPAQIALAIAAGHRHLAVRRSPRIAIIDSGDELSADPETCALHQVPASNGAMIAALAASLPVQVSRIGPVADSREAIIAAFDAVEDADVIVTSGGASVGDHDLIRPALEQWGARLDFWRIAIKPGKPLLVAERDGRLIVGLPGNPVSAMVTSYLFLLPLLRGLLGAARPLPVAIDQRLAGPLPATGDRREFIRARFEAGGVSAVSTQDSGALGALAMTDLLVDRPAGSPALAAGESVRAYLLQNGGLS